MSCGKATETAQDFEMFLGAKPIVFKMLSTPVCTSGLDAGILHSPRE